MTVIEPDKNRSSAEKEPPVTAAMEEGAPEMDEMHGHMPDLPTSLNEELDEKISDDPNKFIGCGG